MKIESDCLQVVHVIRSSFSGFSSVGKVVEECRMLLADLKNQNVIIRFVKRSTNRVAHCLARYNCSLAHCRWKEGETNPDFICEKFEKLMKSFYFLAKKKRRKNVYLLYFSINDMFFIILYTRFSRQCYIELNVP